ncbi:MAG: hypothetical protein IH966_06580, partial [Gemmatimonadetes bacterium]|nr:hypothetical protein [Gemmatimonadota bacterium]
MKKLLGAAMIVVLFSSPTGSLLLAQSATADGNTVFDPALFEGMRYRNIGPSRGGRVTAVTGVASQPATFYMGSTGGGVWK